MVLEPGRYRWHSAPCSALSFPAKHKTIRWHAQHRPAMQERGVKRIVCQSSLGVGDSRDASVFSITFLSFAVSANIFAIRPCRKPSSRRALSIGHRPPTALTNGPRKGVYRVGSGIGHWFFLTKIPVRILRLHAEATRRQQQLSSPNTEPCLLIAALQHGSPVYRV